MLQQLEDDSRRNDVGNVGNTQIKVGEIHLEEIAVNDLEMGRILTRLTRSTHNLRPLHLLLNFIDHARIELHCNHTFGLLQ